MKSKRKGICLVLAAMLIVGILGSVAVAEEKAIRVKSPASQTWIGLDTIFIGRLTMDEDGNLNSILGMSGGLGIAYRRYFKRPEEFRTFHPYWELGTMVLVWPYGTVGVTYPIPLTSRKEKISSLVCINLYVGMLFPVPFVGIGLAATF